MLARLCANGCATTSSEKSGQGNQPQRPNLPHGTGSAHFTGHHEAQRAIGCAQRLAIAGVGHQHLVVAQLGIKFG